VARWWSDPNNRPCRHLAACRDPHCVDAPAGRIGDAQRVRSTDGRRAAPLFALTLSLILPLALTARCAQADPFDLLTLYDELLRNNPSLKGREHEIERAQARRDVAMSKLLPQVNASGNLSWNRLNQTVVNPFTDAESVNQFDYQGSRAIVQASQALFDLSSYYQLQGRASSLRQAEEDLIVMRMSLGSDLVDRYMKVLQADDELSAVRAEQELTASELKRIQRMAGMQLVMQKDLYEVEAFQHNLETRALEVANSKAIALQQLHELAGVDVPDVAPLAQLSLPPVPDDADHWVAIGRESHPALKAVQYGVDAADLSVKAARAQHYPLLRLQMSETYADNGGFDNRQSEPYNIGTLGLQLNVPLYAGGGVEAGVREAIAGKGVAETEQLQRILEIERQTRAVYLQAQTERARIDSLGREVEAREKAREAHQKSYEIGISTIVDALEAKKNLLKSRAEQAAARYNYIRLLVALRLWAGSLSRADIEQINGWLD
jgi:outer membrane protein